MSGGTTPVDVPSGVGPQGFGLDAGSPSLSSDGRFLAFASEDPALSSENKDVDVTLTGDASPVHNVFVYDRTTGHITSSRGAAARRAPPPTRTPTFRRSPPTAATSPSAPRRATSSTASFGGVYVRDLHTKTTTLVARRAAPTASRCGPTTRRSPATGDEVAFRRGPSSARPGTQEIEVRDVRRKRTVLASRASGVGGAIASRDCAEPVDLRQRPLRRLRHQGEEHQPGRTTTASKTCSSGTSKKNRTILVSRASRKPRRRRAAAIPRTPRSPPTAATWPSSPTRATSARPTTAPSPTCSSATCAPGASSSPREPPTTGRPPTPPPKTPRSPPTATT